MKYRIEIQPENAVRKTRLLLTGLALILAAGCVKDKLYNTPHPDRGAVVVTADWTTRSSDAILPESYVLRIGDKEQTVNSETNAFNALFLPGKQDLLIHHQPEGIAVSSSTATVNTLADGTLEPLPGFLFSGMKGVEIVKDDTVRVSVPMQQHIRSLTLALKLNPGDRKRIRTTSATLTGIASAIDLTTGAIASTTGKTVVPAFAIATDNTTRATSQPMLVATLRLLGVMAKEKQVLTLAITLTGDKVQTITTDLTEALKNFATGDNREPLTLDATLTLPAEAGFSATIGDWQAIDNGDIKVN